MGSESGPNDTVGASTTQQGSSKAKGKGVARDEPDQDAPRQADESSVMARLGRSAAGLSRSVLHSTPSANDLATISSSGKVEASSAGNKLETLAETSSAVPSSSSAGGGVFRSGQTKAHVAAEEAAFSEFLDNQSVFVPTEPVGFEKTWRSVDHTDPAPPDDGLSRAADIASVAEQQERDGVEVVRLLSQTEEEMPEYEGQVKLSEQELHNLRQALFEDGSPAQISASDWNNILNFVPDFLRSRDGNPDSTGIAESRFMNLGVDETAEAGQLWLEEWNRVLTSYTDEVWGDLSDLVKEAQTEVQQIRDEREGQGVDPMALRRLQTILTRVRARL